MSSTITPKHPARIGRYTVTGLIGRGGMGTVYRGHDDALDRDVAVKVIHDRFGHSENVLRRFGEEAKNVARLSSPHIVHVHEFDPLATPPFLAMELVRGPSLQQLIRARGQASFATVLDCARQVLAGLATAHSAGIVHRDIKPANVLRGPDGTYKLSDFGLARSLEREQSLTATGSIIGTLHYMAPEVAAGEEATAASDLYSVGVTLYEMLAGTTPFPEESPLRLLRRIAAERPLPVTAHRDDIPPQLEAWLGKLLAHDPGSRFSSAAAALDALRQLEISGVADDAYATLPFEAEACDATAPTAATPRLAGQSPEPIHREQVDSIIRAAMRLEAQGRSLLGDDTVLEIARELHVESRFVRRALADHRAANAPPAPPSPPPNFPFSPAAAPLDPATRVACADAIDRLWWASLVGMLPSIPIVDFPIFFLIELGMLRRPLRFLGRRSRACARGANLVAPLIVFMLALSGLFWFADALPLLIKVFGLFAGIAFVVMCYRLYWNELSGAADLLEQAAAPLEAERVRESRNWGLWLGIGLGLLAITVSIVVTGGNRNGDSLERRFASWLVEQLALLPLTWLLTWLFTLRPLALASRTLRGPFAVASVNPLMASAAYAAPAMTRPARADSGRTVESPLAHSTWLLIVVGLTLVVLTLLLLG